MIAYIRGILAYSSENSVVIETANGIGYEVMIPTSTYEGLPEIGESVFLHTYLQVKEDGIALFGFQNKVELQFFKLLLQVNGIGPKGALGVLSIMSAQDLRFAILSEDIASIAKAPGIGKKTASKVILELKDKVEVFEFADTEWSKQTVKKEKNANEEVRGEAILALVSLGYSQTEAKRAVQAVLIQEGETVELVLKQALKTIGL